MNNLCNDLGKPKSFLFNLLVNTQQKHRFSIIYINLFDTHALLVYNQIL